MLERVTRGVMAAWRGLASVSQRAFEDRDVRMGPAFWPGFAAILALAAILRFWQLGSAPFWMDEAMTLAMARLPLEVILFDRIDNHPVLPYVVQHFWLQLVPDTAYARIPVALAGTASVGAIMLLARDQLAARAALIAGLVFAVSTAQIYYSQELRMYVFLVLGLVLALWGGLGLVNPQRHRMRTYCGLYVIGGAIAIHSQLLGLIAMGLIGFSSLAGGLMTPRGGEIAWAWLKANLVLLILAMPWLIQIPEAVGTFPGLPTEISPFEIHWHLRNAVGYPGLAGIDLVQLAADAMLYGLALAGALVAWFSGRRTLALALGGLLVIYPLLVAGIHMRSSIIHTRALLLGGIAVAIAAGYALSSLRDQRLGVLGTAMLAGFGLASSGIELAYHNKAQDHDAAFALMAEKGFAGVPVLTCPYFSTAATWENRPDAEIYSVRDGAVLAYHGPQFWRALEMSMARFRESSPRQIDGFLGHDYLIEGGLAAVLEDESRVAFLRPICTPGMEARVGARLDALGFEPVFETRLRGNAATFTIIEPPSTHLGLYRRVESVADAAGSGQPGASMRDGVAGPGLAKAQEQE